MRSYAIGLKSLVPNVGLIQTINHHTKIRADIFPEADIKLDDDCKRVMTGGGGVGTFVDSPFMLTNSYPKSSNTWSTKLTNDHNWGFVYKKYERWTRHKYHRRYHWVSYGKPAFAAKSFLTTYAMSFQVEPLKADCQ